MSRHFIFLTEHAKERAVRQRINPFWLRDECEKILNRAGTKPGKLERVVVVVDQVNSHHVLLAFVRGRNLMTVFPCANAAIDASTGTYTHGDYGAVPVIR